MKKIYLSIVAAMISMASFAQVTFTCTAGKNFGENEGMDKLFDGDVNTKYCQNTGDDCYALVTASEAVYVWGYEMTTANDNEQYGRCVTGWKLMGTNDPDVAADASSDQWVNLSTLGSNSYIQRKNYYTQRFYTDVDADNVAYKYFKVCLTDGGFVQLSEFKLLCETTPVVSYKWVEGSSDNAQKVLDHDLGQKWEGNNLAGNWFTVETSDAQPHTVKAYSFTTHDDGSWPERAPKHWTLEGSNDNATWELVDEVSNNPIQNVNYTTFTFTPAQQDKAYRYLKVSLVEMKGTGWTQIGEFYAQTGCETHNWTVTSTVDATCVKDGGTNYECTVCGATKFLSDIPATGNHDFVDRYCTVCGTPDPDAVATDEAGYYTLSTVEDLKWFGAMIQTGVTMNARLANDIDLTDADFSGFGNGDNLVPFTGEFDGNNMTISNLHIDVALKNTGLFGNAKDANIHNLLLKDAYVKTAWGSPNAGGIVGEGDNLTLTECAVIDSYVEGYDHVGALVGNTKNTTKVLDCYSNSDILSGAYQAGGLIGTSNGLLIEHCVFCGTVKNNNYNASGLVALIDGEGAPTTLRSNLAAAKSLYVGAGDGLYSLINTGGRSATYENNYVVATTTYQVAGEEALTREYDDLNGSEGKTVSEEDAKSADFAFVTLGLENTVWACVEGEYPQLVWVVEKLYPGVITGVNAVNATAKSAGIYNIAGQRVAQPVKGINIVNGKKFIVK